MWRKSPSCSISRRVSRRPTKPMSDVVSLGLRRLARQDPDKAMALLDGYASSMHFSRDEKVAIARKSA
jgi:soluble lytic murein transglycosylase